MVGEEKRGTYVSLSREKQNKWWDSVIFSSKNKNEHKKGRDSVTFFYFTFIFDKIAKIVLRFIAGHQINLLILFFSATNPIQNLLFHH